MILLFNHVSSFRYQATERTDIGQELEEGEQRGQTGEALLVKISTEPEDTPETVIKAVEEITDVATQLGGIEQVILFPWAHLTDNLSDPKTAQEILEELTTEVQRAGYNVIAAPFGWYKEWELQSKGHPLSVLRRAVE